MLIDFSVAVKRSTVFVVHLPDTNHLRLQIRYEINRKYNGRTDSTFLVRSVLFFDFYFQSLKLDKGVTTMRSSRTIIVYKTRAFLVRPDRRPLPPPTGRWPPTRSIPEFIRSPIATSDPNFSGHRKIHFIRAYAIYASACGVLTNRVVFLYHSFRSQSYFALGSRGFHEIVFLITHD